MATKTNEELLKALKKANKERRQVMAERAGYKSYEEYRDALESNQSETTQEINPKTGSERPVVYAVDIIDCSASMMGKPISRANDAIKKGIDQMMEDKNVDFFKLKATILFDKWLSEYISQLPSCDTVLETNYIKESLSSFKHRIYGQCGDYSWTLPITKWYYGIYKQLKGHAYFSSKSFLKYFLISIINRVHG